MPDYGKQVVVGGESLSCARLFVTLWSTAPQAPLSLGFSKQEHSGSGLPALLQGIFPNPDGPCLYVPLGRRGFFVTSVGLGSPTGKAEPNRKKEDVLFQTGKISRRRDCHKPSQPGQHTNLSLKEAPGLHGGTPDKKPPANTGDTGWIPAPGRAHELAATKAKHHNY